MMIFSNLPNFVYKLAITKQGGGAFTPRRRLGFNLNKSLQLEQTIPVKKIIPIKGNHLCEKPRIKFINTYTIHTCMIFTYISLYEQFDIIDWVPLECCSFQDLKYQKNLSLFLFLSQREAFQYTNDAQPQFSENSPFPPHKENAMVLIRLFTAWKDTV